MPRFKNRTIKRVLTFTASALAGTAIVLFLGITLAAHSLVRSDPPFKADAIVVLSNSTEIYLRMTEAAALYREGYSPKVVINGGRIDPVVKEMREKGFTRQWRWEEEYTEYLQFLGVPLEDVLFITLEDPYDTWGEADLLGRRLDQLGIKKLIITTSKYHSRRAGYIWEKLYGEKFDIRVVPVRSETFSPWSWWKDRRQFKWTLYEMGSWLFLLARGLPG